MSKKTDKIGLSECEVFDLKWRIKIAGITAAVAVGLLETNLTVDAASRIAGVKGGLIQECLDGNADNLTINDVVRLEMALQVPILSVLFAKRELIMPRGDE